MKRQEIFQIKDKLDEVRKARKLTHNQLAEMLKMKESTFFSFLKRNDCKLSEIERIAKALDVDPYFLLGVETTTKDQEIQSAELERYKMQLLLEKVQLERDLLRELLVEKDKRIATLNGG